MSVEIVVARYNEDVSWLKEIDHPVVLYNKNEEPIIDIPAHVHFINDVPNVGREAYVYLKYIVDHYDALSDITVFLQAGIHEHQAGFPTPSEFIECLIEEAVSSGLSTRTTIDCIDTHGDFTIDFWYTSIDPSLVRPLDAWFEHFTDTELPTNPLRWIPAAMFAVRQDHIRKRPRSFYTRLLHTVDHHVNPEAVYFLERSWYQIFK
jgi:hypothetical protein